MFELSISLVFRPRDWGFGFSYPEASGKDAIPAIALHIQFIFLIIQFTLYRTWEMEDE